MEEQLSALGLGHGASVAEELYLAKEPKQWSELHDALKDVLGSRGTLTKTLARLVAAGIVTKTDGRYLLSQPERVGALLEAAARLNAEVLEERAVGAAARARELQKSSMTRRSERVRASATTPVSPSAGVADATGE